MIVKGAPWTRSSLSTLGNGGSAYEAYSAAPSRQDPYSMPQQLRAPASNPPNPYSNPSRPPESRAQPAGFSSGSILAFPSSQVRPGDAEQRRAQKQELFEYYQAAMREKALRGKDDVSKDPLKARAGELSQQYDRDRARVRKAIGASILSSDTPLNEGRRPGNSSFSVPAQDLRSRGNPIEDIENLRRRKAQDGPSFGLKTSNSVKSYQENAALFYGEPPQAAVTQAKVVYIPPQKGVSSFQENTAKFYGEANPDPKAAHPSQPFDSLPQSRPPQKPSRSFEENKAAFFGADGVEVRQISRTNSVVSTGKPPSSFDQNKAAFFAEGQQGTFTNSPILGKTIPKSTISDPITGVVRTVSSQRPRFQPLGKEKPDIFVGKINDSPAPPVDTYGSQPSYTKKSGNKPYSYNPLTGQEYEYGAGNPFRGSAAYMR